MKKAPSPPRQQLPSDLTYGSYLGLDALLDLQRPLSQPANHDEMQFIIVHQGFELWFRQMLHEVDAIFAHLAADRTREAERLFRRLGAITRCFLPALKVIETMVPSDFLQFRDLLKPASGFQSWQFRALEFACGVRDERYLRMFDGDKPLQERLRKRLTSPSLWDAFAGHIARLGWKAANADEQAASIARIYKDERASDLRALCEAMIEFDEDFQLYREHHIRMAERMIGHKVGTGEKTLAYSLGHGGPMGTHGVEYLRTTLGKKFFPVLWAARTGM